MNILLSTKVLTGVQFVAAAPGAGRNSDIVVTAYDVDAVSYASSALQMGQTALCLAVVPPGDDLAALEPGADDGGRPAPGE